MKRKNRVAERLRLPRVLAAFLLATMLVPGERAVAQSDACGDTLTLFSPTDLTVEFEKIGTPGNQLWWPDLETADAACFRLETPPDVDGRIAPEVVGTYVDIHDRRLVFTATDSGLVGDTTLDQVRLGFASFPPNDAVPAFTGILNLSDRGGIFLGDVTAVTAAQASQGIPAHLPLTNVTGVGATTVPGGGLRLYAAVSGLPLVRSDDGGATWFEPTVSNEPAIGVPANHVAVSPSNPDLVFLGTSKEGLYRSDDGGVTWTRGDAALTSGDPEVTLAKYLKVENSSGTLVDRLYLSLSGIGFFFSDDDGASWTEVSTLVLPAIEITDVGRRVRCDILPEEPTQVRVRDVAVSPADPTRVYVALRDWAVYKTSDHLAWERANLGMVYCAGVGASEGGPIDAEDPNNPTGVSTTVTRLFVAPMSNGGDDVIYAATESDGVYLSSDGGATWDDVTSSQGGYPVDADNLPVRVAALLEDPADPLSVLVATQSAGFVTFRMGGWSPWAPGGLTNPKIGSVVPLPGSNGNSLFIGTTGAGVYTRGEELNLTRSLEVAAAFEGAQIDLGLRLIVNGTDQMSGDEFELLGQTYQAYAVWRATEVDLQTQEPQWEMIGLLDLTNPEACSMDTCDSPSQATIPGCFADKRANCFSTRTVGGEFQRGFFDSDVFNGFTYQYAVSTLDYGFTGDVSPLVFDGEFVFSPRSPQESNPQATLFMDARPENYAIRTFQVNVDATVDLSNVFVVPNPLRRQGGWDSGAESTVRFVNVTDTSKVEVFTLAGDIVRELENVVTEGVERGNIQWDTRNAEGKLVASGVYIYRVTDGAGGEFISRMTIIR